MKLISIRITTQIFVFILGLEPEEMGIRGSSVTTKEFCFGNFHNIHSGGMIQVIGIVLKGVVQIE